MAITLSIKRASEESGLSPRFLQYAIGDGRLSSVLVGKRRLIPVRALEEFLLGRASRDTSATRNRRCLWDRALARRASAKLGAARARASDEHRRRPLRARVGARPGAGGSHPGARLAVM
jgi:hypothetical protein